ncbi:tyrosine--tRNA ligase [Rickettsiales bacterium]|nr:tyrosine--tRNA ligase [Rickettsiales bacterium]
MDAKNVHPQSDFMQNIIKNGLYNNSTNQHDIDQKLLKKEIITYVGFDLTAYGLHIGHLMSLMLLKKLIATGNKCIIILGGATTYIGDPSGKTEMRKMLSPEGIKNNKKGICGDILRILLETNEPQNIDIDLDNEIVFKNENITILDNYYWLKQLNYIDLLRQIGPYFSINKMIKADSVESRLNSQQSLSFLEFNYPILQAYDFYHLAKNYGCNCEFGGSDQWGNILRGVELVDNLLSKKVYGLTTPLVTTADGKKMGKSENGAVWLNPELLDDQKYWQYFRNVHDKDVEKFFHIFTNLSQQEIDEVLEKDINSQKEHLATTTTSICRGHKEATNAMQKTKQAFCGEVKSEPDYIVEPDVVLSEIIQNFNIANAKSKSDIRRLVSSNGIKIDNVPVQNINDKICDATSKSIFNIKIGKKNVYTIEIKAKN